MFRFVESYGCFVFLAQTLVKGDLVWVCVCVCLQELLQSSRISISVESYLCIYLKNETGCFFLWEALDGEQCFARLGFNEVILLYLDYSFSSFLIQFVQTQCFFFFLTAETAKYLACSNTVLMSVVRRMSLDTLDLHGVYESDNNRGKIIYVIVLLANFGLKNVSV